MSRLYASLQAFISNLAKNKMFSERECEEYVKKKQPSKGECLSSFKDGILKFNNDAQKYKEAAVAIWFCAIREIEECFD